ncbi:MAG TPA: tetratricopeptide repeat protein [Bryobacteraceae bacterium]|nr:tetratricopeptide repeat protein [Bryobacteraceae bacterium]
MIFTIATVFVSLDSSDANWEKRNRAALAAADQFRYAEAEAQFRALLEPLAENDPRFAATLIHLAKMREQQGDYNAAERLGRRALEVRQKNLPENDLSIADAFESLGSIVLVEGRPDEAYALLRRALWMDEFAGDDARIAEALGEIGLALMSLHQPARAEPVLRRSLSLYEKTKGADSIEAARISNSIATLEDSQHQYQKAERDLRRALPAFERALGPNNPMVAAVLDNLFAEMAAQRRASQGEPFLARAVRIMDNLQSELPPLLQIRANQAAFEAIAGNLRESTRIFEEVIAAEQRVFGASHPEVARTISVYSGVLKRMHKNKEARQAENRANAILKSFR